MQNNSIDITVLKLKESFANTNGDDINKWSLLEQAIKEIIKYQIIFSNKLNIYFSFRFFQKIGSIWFHCEKTSLNIEEVYEIFSGSGLKISEYERKELKSIYENRNKEAHHNVILGKGDEKIIFDLINKLKNQICSKININE